MPTYDYECSSCGHTFELFQSITAKPRKTCPACGRRTAKRLIGAGAGIIFRGSGFYQTDYRSKDYRKAAKAETKAASGKEENKSDSCDTKASLEPKRRDAGEASKKES